MKEEKIFIGSYTNVVKKYIDESFFNNLYKLSKENDVYIIDNSLNLEYFNEIVNMCKDYKNFQFKHLDFPIEPKESIFQRRVTGCANHLRDLFLKGNYKYFMSIESDVLPPIDIIERFNNSISTLPDNWGILGALYHGLHGNKEDGRIGHHDFPDIPKIITGLYQPEQVLSGCTIYKKEIIMKYPFRYDENDLGQFHDHFICEDAKNNGYTIWDDRDIDCQHFPSASIQKKDIK